MSGLPSPFVQPDSGRSVNETVTVLTEIAGLIRGGRLPHGDCSVNVGRPCNCYLTRVPQLLAVLRKG